MQVNAAEHVNRLASMARRSGGAIRGLSLRQASNSHPKASNENYTSLDRVRQPAGARSSTAFTLLEIMIVIAIIGLLLAIAVPSFVKSRQRAQRELCIENLHQIETAKQLLALEHGSRANEVLFLDDIAGPGLYLKVEPECPAGGEYHVNPVRIPAECTIEGHVLEWNE